MYAVTSVIHIPSDLTSCRTQSVLLRLACSVSSHAHSNLSRLVCSLALGLFSCARSVLWCPTCPPSCPLIPIRACPMPIPPCRTWSVLLRDPLLIETYFEFVTCYRVMSPSTVNVTSAALGSGIMIPFIFLLARQGFN